MRDDTRLESIKVLDADRLLALFREASRFLGVADQDHCLFLVSDPELLSTDRAKSAASRGEKVGVLVSLDFDFLERALRHSYRLRRNFPAPVKREASEFELCGEPLRRLLSACGFAPGTDSTSR